MCEVADWSCQWQALVGSSASASTCTDATWTFSLSACAWPSLFSECFLGLHTGHLTILIPGSMDLKEAAMQYSVLTCLSSLSRMPSHSRSAHMRKWTCDFRRCLNLITKPKGALTLGWCLYYGNLFPNYGTIQALIQSKAQ